MDTEHQFQQYAPRIAYLALVGSQAYGLATPESDRDLRGFYIARPRDLWSLQGVPDSIRGSEDVLVWELARCFRLALKADPNTIEALYSPVVVQLTEDAQRVLLNRDSFLSQRVYRTYQHYATSQLQKLEQDIRTGGQVRWKHVMHLLRLLLSGTELLRTGEPLIEVGPFWREQFLAIKRGEWTWPQVDERFRRLQHDFEEAASVSRLPVAPDEALVNTLLIEIRLAQDPRA